jgi:hypothetical protein
MVITLDFTERLIKLGLGAVFLSHDTPEARHDMNKMLALEAYEYSFLLSRIFFPFSLNLLTKGVIIPDIWQKVDDGMPTLESNPDAPILH